jgi:hypothetical protein
LDLAGSPESANSLRHRYRGPLPVKQNLLSELRARGLSRWTGRHQELRACTYPLGSVYVAKEREDANSKLRNYKILGVGSH